MLKTHNPNGVTDKELQPELGWRLLDEDEIVGRWGVSIEDHQIECYDRPKVGKPHCWFRGGYHGAAPALTYRTKLTRAELRAIK